MFGRGVLNCSCSDCLHEEHLEVDSGIEPDPFDLEESGIGCSKQNAGPFLLYLF